MIYKEDNKKAENLLKDILEFCINNNFPKEFCSENGPEFKNSKFKDLGEKKVSFIYMLFLIFPIYRAVERFHYTIQKYFAKEYIKKWV